MCYFKKQKASLVEVTHRLLQRNTALPSARFCSPSGLSEEQQCKNHEANH